MKTQTLGQILEKYPFVYDFFQQNRLDINGFEKLTLPQYFAQMDEDMLEEKAIDPEKLLGELNTYIEQMLLFLGLEQNNRVHSLSILPGTDKNGLPERFESLVLYPSQVVSIVGHTGSGKSRLLADIEWVAQGDTPSGRKICINDAVPDLKWRYSPQNKLVAQLSQNMNFVMDLSVEEFLRMHAHSRLVENADRITRRILEEANQLAGEPFFPDTPVTSLSGGQSRALMIADTAILSTSPIVLIDEIENAGIDRKKALGLLVAQDKIVLMATHDPLLALMADKRIVIQNGGISTILETTLEEKAILKEMQQIDQIMQRARGSLRQGCVLHQQEIFT